MLELVEDLRLGDHAALFYRSRAEQLAWMIPYVRIGLARNERCLYIADDNSVLSIFRKLQEAGVDTDTAQASGALSVVTKQETYLRHGLFEPAKMIADLKEAVQSALQAGFTGLRATGEMTWALDLPSALARMIEYETALQREFPAEFVAICQYDETRYPEHIIDGMRQLHPVILRNKKVTRQAPTAGELAS
ncbi:MAG TPA: MEDS domain-containing protein [Methylomirabilota bacterium]|nr:MEDS domain-containing protein [Methylomirabilota bacterium]